MPDLKGMTQFFDWTFFKSYQTKTFYFKIRSRYRMRKTIGRKEKPNELFMCVCVLLWGRNYNHIILFEDCYDFLVRYLKRRRNAFVVSESLLRNHIQFLLRFISVFAPKIITSIKKSIFTGDTTRVPRIYF